IGTRCIGWFALVKTGPWRTLFACRLARSCPEIGCEVIFEPCEWRSVWMAVHRQSPPPAPPRLEQMNRQGIGFRIVIDLHDVGPFK
ncbi:MAG: hypothetical protein KAY37_02630, partial [Phycisphaerae bacterium]|nr:hypothetical protein [Phycisphaerae bacterium]